MISLENYKKAIKNLPEYITECEINAEQKVSMMVSVSGGKVAKTNFSDVTSVYVRASGTKTGYAYTEDLGEEPVNVILRAYNNGIFSDSNKIDRLNSPETAFNEKLLKYGKQAEAENVIYGVAGSTAEKIEKETAFSDILAKALMMEEIIKTSHPAIKTVFVNIRKDTFSSSVINSMGVDVCFTRHVYYAQSGITAEISGDIADTLCAVSAASLEKLDPYLLVKQAGNFLKNKMEPGSFTSGEFPVILSRNVGVNIMMTAWQLFSGLKYCDGSTALKGRLGEVIGSPALSIIDMPFHNATGYCFPFDCEGTTGRETVLVDKGKFTGLMHNLASAAQLNAVPTGNAGRVALLTGNVPTDIIITPKICCIMPGARSAEEWIKEMDEGVYITESYDIFHSINIGSGDFAIPCKGVVIKDGRPHHSAAALTICGNLLDLFNNIEETGNDLFIDEFLLKSYCVGSPCLRIRKLQVNGK